MAYWGAGWFVAAAIAACPTTLAAQTSQETVVQVAFAAWQDKIQALQQRFVEAGPPKSIAEDVRRRVEMSDALRPYQAPDGLSSEQVRRLSSLRDPIIAAYDEDDTQFIKAILPKEGWFNYERYGAVGGDAWLIVQHSRDPALQREILDRLTKLRNVDGVSAQQFALLFDRVTLRETGAQRYGSQFQCSDGHMTVAPMADPDKVQERRDEIGFTSPRFATYAKDLSGRLC